MEAEATPQGPGEEEADLPLENKVANQDRALEGGVQMSKSGNLSGRRASSPATGDWNCTLAQDRGKAERGAFWPPYASCQVSDPLL